MKKIFKFSAYQYMFNIINYFSRNLDKILIGKYMGMSSLGYYEKSYRLMMLPLQNITHVFTPVIHPIFSDYQHDLDHLATSYEKIIRLLAFYWFTIIGVSLVFRPRNHINCVWGKMVAFRFCISDIIDIRWNTDHNVHIRFHFSSIK